MVKTGTSVAIAFSLTIGAGMATLLGGAVIFNQRLINWFGGDRFLAAALAVSAGVVRYLLLFLMSMLYVELLSSMLLLVNMSLMGRVRRGAGEDGMVYVSFMEIFSKSYDHFILAGNSEPNSYAFATLCFFGGFIAVYLLDIVVHAICARSQQGANSVDEATGRDASSVKNNREKTVVRIERETLDEKIEKGEDDSIIAESYPVLGESTSNTNINNIDNNHGNNSTNDNVGPQDTWPDSNLPKDSPPRNMEPPEMSAVALDVGSGDTNSSLDGKNKATLFKTGALTALAITVHNFPEGIATFVGALNDPKVGGALAFAIGIHNIPEGLCVAVPIFFSTGSKKKAFIYVVVSALAEPLAAFIAWLFLSEHLNDLAFAIIFGLVGGIMVVISLKGLLPCAINHDPNDEVVSTSLFVGMLVMAASL
eukprot:Ihof_evm1s714 gene=Ihof_evmTU1s714